MSAVVLVFANPLSANEGAEQQAGSVRMALGARAMVTVAVEAGSVRTALGARVMVTVAVEAGSVRTALGARAMVTVAVEGPNASKPC